MFIYVVFFYNKKNEKYELFLNRVLDSEKYCKIYENVYIQFKF